ncbi:hypothetical protein [Pedobacter sp.]|uniref:hypothetical protein n=1 Tax=Pedobacter sp. TaxID=1411316 RepID=UPI003BAAC1B9
MEFYKAAKLIFLAIPEFEYSYKEELNPDYYNLFLGDFGLFVRDAIKHNNKVAVRCLVFISDLVNNNVNDEDFLNKMSINILEVLTDYRETQIDAVKYFSGHCLSMFQTLLDNGYFNNLVD